MCKFCERKLNLVGGIYSHYDNYTALAYGGWTVLGIGLDKFGKVIMFGEGDGVTDFYYPKFCPECGKDLKEASDGTQI